MPLGTLSAMEREIDLKHLDDLIAALERYGHAELLLEHLRSARAYLLGAMPAEYAATLQQAKEVCGRVDDKDLRQVLKDTLEYLLATVLHAGHDQAATWRHHSHLPHHADSPPGARSRLWDIFGAEAKSFGVFYPLHHIIVVFASLELAQEAERALRQAGFAEGEVLAISDHDMLKFVEEFRSHEGVWGALMTELSRIFATEAIYVDRDLQMANKGAAFLAVYSPVNEESDHIRETVVPFGPLSMRRYLSGSIQSLI